MIKNKFVLFVWSLLAKEILVLSAVLCQSASKRRFSKGMKRGAFFLEGVKNSVTLKQAIIFFLLFFLREGLGAGLFAQQFQAGILAGVSTSQVDGDTYAGYNKLGFVAGGFVSTKISSGSKWRASFELSYIQKGSRKIPHPDKGDYTFYKLKFNYVEIPILLKYSFTTIDSMSGWRQERNFSLEGGLAFAVLVDSEEEDIGGPVFNASPFQKYDYSAILGLNYFITKHVGFNIRTEYSIFPVRKGGTSSYYYNWTHNFLKPGFYNNLIAFSVRYRF